MRIRPTLILRSILQLTIVWFALSGFVKAEQKSFIKYGIEDGFVDNYCLDILQDQHKFVWTISQSSVFRFDGRTFTNVAIVDSMQVGVGGAELYCIGEKKNGEILLGTNLGCFSYNPITEIFDKQLTKRATYNINAVSDSITYLLEDGSVKVIDEDCDSIKHYNLPGVWSFIIDVEVLAEDKWLIATRQNGLYIFNPIDNGVQKLTTLKANSLRFLKRDPYGRFWVGSRERGVIVLDENLEVVKIIIPQNNEWKNSPLLSVCFADSLAYIGSDGAGVFSVGYDEEIAHPCFKEEKVLEKVMSIRRMFLDCEQNLWLGTVRNGIVKETEVSPFKFYKEGEHHNELSHKSILTLLHEEDKGIWLGTDGGGLNYYDLKKKQLIQMPDGSARKINGLALYNDQKLLVSRFPGGLEFFDKKQKRYLPAKELNKKLRKISPNRNNYTIINDKYGNIWFGGQTLLSLNPRTNELVECNNIKAARSLFVENDSIMWVGSFQGLWRLNINKGGVESYKKIKGGDEELIGGTPVFSILKDSHDNLWVGTRRGLVYRSSDGVWRKPDDNPILKSNSVFSIAEDSTGHICISTKYRLHLLDYDMKELRTIGYKDGLMNMPLSLCPMVVMKDEMYIGGTSGFLRLNTNNLDVRLDLPLSFEIERISFMNNNRQAELIHSGDKIIVDNKDAYFKIDFFALDFNEAHKVKYLYRLEPGETTWNETTENFVRYSGLRPGEYTFKLGIKKENKLLPVERVLHITVLPPWYLTWWFWTSVVLVVLLIMWWLKRNALVKLQLKHDLDIERVERQKSDEMMEARIQLYTNISHEFRTPLSLIFSPLQSLMKKESLDIETKSSYQLMHRNARNLMTMVDQLINFRKHEVKGVQLSLSTEDLVQEIRNTVSDCRELAKDKAIRIRFYSDFARLNYPFDREKMSWIIYNLLSNAIKYTQTNGEINIRILEVEDEIKLEVEDNGIGISEDDLAHIFDRFYQVDEKNSGFGIGLAFTKVLVEKHGGRIEVESKTQEGTKFIVSLPQNQVEEQRAVVVEDVCCEEPEEEIEEKGQTGYRVLVVEDEPEMLKYLVSKLQPLYHVETAYNGDEALRILGEQKVNLIITDVLMPKMDGYEFCTRLKQNPEFAMIPILVLSGQSTEAKISRFFKLGIEDYMVKPFSDVLLLSRIENILNYRRDLTKRFITGNLNLNNGEDKVSDSELMENLVEFIFSRIQEPGFNVSDVITHLGGNKKVAYQLVSDQFNISIKKLIDQIKVERATGLLKEDKELSIAEIATLCGFNDPKYFSTWFKRSTGEKPSIYRENGVS
ncbi:hybrid sensor histidine kinase/response regulator [Puteibacter caeruleilacunae]|nr:hybrid sensor histidine kinase/response regulator [Puteibacter caeruleilacunae]